MTTENVSLPHPWWESSFQEHTYFHFRADAVQKGKPDYPFMEFAEDRDLQMHDFLNNDVDYFYSIQGLCTFESGYTTFDSKLVTFVASRIERAEKEVASLLTAHLAFVLVPPTHFGWPTLNTDAFASFLDTKSIGEAYFRQIDISYVLAVPQEKRKATIALLGCRVAKIRLVGLMTDSNFKMEKCSLGLVEHVSSKRQSESGVQLFVEDCRLEYVNTDAKNIHLRNIPEINILRAHKPSEVIFLLENVVFRYRPEVLSRYAFWRNPAFDFIGVSRETYLQRKRFDGFRAYYSTYFRRPTGSDSIAS